MVSKPTAPTPLDPTKVASEQTQSNVQTAAAQSQLNNVNQQGPWGSVKYTQTPGIGGVPSWTQTTTLSPAQQKLLQQQNGNALTSGQQVTAATQRLGGLMAQNPIDTPNYQTYSGAPTLSTRGGTIDPIQSKLPTTDYGANVQQVRDAMFARANPQIEQDRTRLETQLANQGIGLGTDAWKAAHTQLEQNINDRRTSIDLAGSQEQSRLAGLDLASGSFANSAQQQKFGQTLANAGFGNEQIQQMFQNGLTIKGLNNDLKTQDFGNSLTARNQGINEVNSLKGGGQVTQPQFPGTSQTGIAGTDTAGIAQGSYQQAYQQYLQQSQQQQQLLGGLFGGISNVAMGLSDRRAKENVRQVGTTFDGQPIYFFTYIGSDEPRMGLMAQDLQKRDPDAVVEIDGLLHVDYVRALAGAVL